MNEKRNPTWPADVNPECPLAPKEYWHEAEPENQVPRLGPCLDCHIAGEIWLEDEREICIFAPGSKSCPMPAMWSFVIWVRKLLTGYRMQPMLRWLWGRKTIELLEKAETAVERLKGGQHG